MQPLLELHNIYYSYHTLDGETSALSDLSFSIQSGEFVAIVGPSGCGKSTLLSLICGLMQPESGEILLNGIPLNHISIQWIGYMLQHDHLLEWRTIYRNVILGPEITGTLTKLKKEKSQKTSGTIWSGTILQFPAIRTFRRHASESSTDSDTSARPTASAA